MLNYNKNKREISPSLVAIIGALIIMLGGFFISYNYIESKKVLAYDYVSTEFFSKNEETKQIITESEDTKIREAVTGEESDVVTNDFIGYLTIPKINLRKGFLDRRSTENDVEKNIYVVEGSTYPDVKRGNLIIAGHSGTGWKAFFNDLYKLGKGDYAIVSYKGKKYTYSITSIYKQSKTGKIAIYRNYDKTTLTLITCTNYDSKTQTVYVAELISTENE